MNHANRAELEQIGLSPTEAQVYLALIQNASLSASALAGVTGLSRTSVYQMLCSLADKGLVNSGTGYGTRVTLLPPDEALPSLVVREREMLAERERVADKLGQRLASLVSPTETLPEELIQVIRNPKVIAERFDRLQLEAERQVDGFIKGPILNPANGNPAQQKAQRRGVRYRGLYERAALEEPALKPFIEGWVAAGEEIRVYDGELPHKLAIFDSEIVLLALSVPGEQMRALFIRHPQLAMSLRLLFESLWERAAPLAGVDARKKTKARQSRLARNSNHH